MIARYIIASSVQVGGPSVHRLNVPPKHLSCHTASPAHTQVPIQLLQGRHAWKSASRRVINCHLLDSPNHSGSGP